MALFIRVSNEKCLVKNIQRVVKSRFLFLLILYE